jgi:Zn-dependent metalloprotease
MSKSNHRKCRCEYVPPYVLNKVAGRGADGARSGARVSIQQGEASRRTRSRRQVSPEAFIAGSVAPAESMAARPSDGVRFVYDCNNEWNQQVGDPARGETDPPAGDTDVDVVWDFAGSVRDYFSGVLGRNSIDNLGLDLILNVHYGEDYMNAFWDGTQMTFGDGDGEVFSSFALSLEVAAHELCHGVTEFTAGLDYYSQSGALNEHFSDVFGSAIVQHAAGQQADEADWLIGNEIVGPTLFGESLRSMQAPGSAYDNSLLGADPQPAHMTSYFQGPEDHQGVHINSGIPNRAFYLVAMDKGTMEAAKVWYHALQNLWPTAAFNDAVEVLVESARTLTRDGEVSDGMTQTVRLAFKDVGLPL